VTLALLMQLAASAITIAGQWAYGNRSLYGPVLGLMAQVPWWIIMVQGSLWGLIPVNVSMLIVHTRNLRIWMKVHNG
jgi:hypothetical protein